MDEVENKQEVETLVDHNFHREQNQKITDFEKTRSAEYFEYRRKWEGNPQKHIVGEFPIHLDVEATLACNLKCVMCPRTELLEKGELWDVAPFDMNLYKRIIDEGARNGLCSVKFNYHGEPLMNKNIFSMIEIAKDAGVVDVMFNTNATLLSEEISIKLINSGLDKLFFSFDSTNKDKYESIRVGASYDKVLGNIKNFMRLRKEMGKVTPFTRASMVLMKGTEDEWVSYKALFEPIVDAVAYVDYLTHTGQNDGRELYGKKILRKKYCCPQLWQRAFVHTDGVVTPCCVDAKREMKMGNVNESSLAEIWQGKAYTELRKLHREGRFRENPQCARCPMTHL